MPKEELDMDYNIRTLQSMIYDQAKRYFKYSKNFDDDTDSEKVAELANKCAYNINIAGAVHKVYKQETRIKNLEDKMLNIPIDTSMFEEPPLQEYR